MADFGGLTGVRDQGLLESAMARPRQLFAYGHTDIVGLAAAYATGVVRNHPLHDPADAVRAVLLLRGHLNAAPDPVPRRSPA